MTTRVILPIILMTVRNCALSLLILEMKWRGVVAKKLANITCSGFAASGLTVGDGVVAANH